jgi:hypothetical protein
MRGRLTFALSLLLRLADHPAVPRLQRTEIIPYNIVKRLELLRRHLRPILQDEKLHRANGQPGHRGAFCTLLPASESESNRPAL